MVGFINLDVQHTHQFVDFFQHRLIRQTRGFTGIQVDVTIKSQGNEVGFLDVEKITRFTQTADLKCKLSFLVIFEQACSIQIETNMLYRGLRFLTGNQPEVDMPEVMSD